MNAPRVSLALAVALAVAILGFGLLHGTGVAGGSDSYGYVSQADLWLSGGLRVQVPVATEVPWPRAIDTFTPLGYSRARSGPYIIPTYSPGLPLLMAAATRLFGDAAKFFVVPLCGALLVMATFWLGRRLGSDDIGIGAAWLVSTSPVVLFMVMQPMSDVPTAAFWSLALVGATGGSRRSALLGGVAAAIATLIKPNLAPVAAVIAIWILWRDAATRTGWRRLLGAMLFSIPMVPAALTIARINTTLYGAWNHSGYGTLRSLYAWSNAPINFKTYGGFLVDVQSPFIVLGMLCLAVPLIRVWRTTEARRVAVLLAGVMLTVLASYLFYEPFDGWWYLRFLLPAFPAMCLGTVALLAWLLPRRRTVTYIACGLAVVALGIHGLRAADTRHILNLPREERKYAVTAQLMNERVDPHSVILASQESGSLMYYGGRQIMRYDELDGLWLDRAVDYLQQRGSHPYALLENWEVPLFRRRFAAHSRLGALRMNPVFTWDGPSEPALYDLLAPDSTVADRHMTPDPPDMPRFPPPHRAPPFLFVR